MQFTDQIFVLLVVIFSAVIHEVMHGAMADWLGDKTAKYAGRLTLNPLPHLDPFGSVLLPLFLTLTNSPVFFAWAKPVPYNPYNLRADGIFARLSEPLVAAAGPLSNIAIAFFFGFLIRVHAIAGTLADVAFLVILVNTMLALFNLIPIPPLDGSKVLEAFLPRSMVGGYLAWRGAMESNPLAGMGLALLIIIVLGDLFGSFVYDVSHAIAGI